MQRSRLAAVFARVQGRMERRGRRLARRVPALAPVVDAAVSALHLARVHPWATASLGYTHTRSRTRVELEMTYECNLHCFNCNRSSTQAKGSEAISLAQVERFLDDSVARGIRWRRIALLGGEPTLHPALDDILTALRRYRDSHSPGMQLVIKSNGFGRRVRETLARVPPDVKINNSAKESREQPDFHSFNLAPVDDRRYQRAEFENGCHIIEDCGMGVSPYGYYPCGPAAGIDRVFGWNIGRKSLPADDDDMRDILARTCAVCGHFKARALGPREGVEQSETWREAYARFTPSVAPPRWSGDEEPPLVTLTRRTRAP